MKQKKSNGGPDDDDRQEDGELPPMNPTTQPCRLSGSGLAPPLGKLLSGNS